MNIDSIKNGIVIDHITAGKAMQIYNLLGLDRLECSVAIIKNVNSNRMGKKDIVKIDGDFELDVDVLGYIDPGITVNVIKDNANYRFFSQGLSKMHCDSIVKDIVIANSFCEGNPITRKVVLEYFIDTVVGRMNSETYTSLYDVTDDISLIVLKALHFEEYGKSREGYTTVTAQEYRDFVLNVNYYKGVIDKNPFDKEKYIEKFINKISQRQAVSGVYSSFKECHHITCVDNYFCDALCNLAWKAIAGVADWLNAYDENISNSRNVSDVFDILVTYFENTDEYDDLEIEQFCNEDKNGDIEVYNTISGDVRSRLEPVDLENE